MKIPNRLTANSIIGLLVILVLAGCGRAEPTTAPAPSSGATSTFTVTATATQTLTPTSPPTETATSTPQNTPVLEPPECRTPPDDYEIVEINGNLLNKRTLSMLEYAQTLYGGEIDLAGYAITQGSFHDNGAASFGTHLGGGAVDLSVMRPNTYTVLYEDIPAILRALRLAGFAAWLRELDEVYPGSAIHIHAIAIGDRDLSEAAQAQLTWESGYFRGFSGLPAVNGSPTLDRYGGPVICQWMRELGYEDLRPVVTPTVQPSP